jgi:hypothetical protein
MPATDVVTLASWDLPHIDSRLKHKLHWISQLAGLPTCIQPSYGILFMREHTLASRFATLPELSKKKTKTNLCGLSPRAIIRTERRLLVGEVSENFLWIEGATWSM